MRILLCRHSKSSWKYPQLDDRDRPLNKRGRRDARLMADRLFEREQKVDLIYTSPAVRARTYADVLAVRFSAPVQEIEVLYTFSIAELWQAVWTIMESCEYQSIAVVGHNPAMLMMAKRLGFGQINHFPTSAVLAVEIDKDEAKVDDGLSYFDYPKNVI